MSFLSLGLTCSQPWRVGALVGLVVGLAVGPAVGAVGLAVGLAVHELALLLYMLPLYLSTMAWLIFLHVGRTSHILSAP